MRRVLGAIALLSAVVLTTAACAAAEGSSDDDQIPVGVNIELSGALVNPVDSHRYIFKIPPNNDDMAAGQAREIADRGYTDVGYISPSDAYGDASLEAFTPLAERAGLKRRCRTVRARHRRRKRGDAHGVP